MFLHKRKKTASSKAGNGISDILTSEDVENTPLEQFRMNFIYFPLKHCCLYNKRECPPGGGGMCID